MFSNSFLQANEVLLAGKKLTAEEALDRNLLTKVIPDASFEKFIEEKLQYLASLPPKVLAFKLINTSYIYELYLSQYMGRKRNRKLQKMLVEESFIWVKVLKNGPSKICGRQPLKKIYLVYS